MKVIFSCLFFLASIYYLNSQFPQIKWWFDTFDSCFGQTALGDIDNDGKPELVFGCYRNDSCIYALNAEDGSLLWKFNTSETAEGCNDVAPILFDSDGDGKLEVFVPSSCTPVTYCLNGATGEVIWKTQTRGSDSPPTIADLDNDGNFEILHGEFGGYVICINAKTGVKLWEIAVDTNSWIQTAPTIADLNNDGQLDFVVATWNFNENNKIFAFDGLTQKILWSVQLDDYVYHGTAVADFDSDGKPECVIGDYSGKLRMLNAEDGSIVWSFQAPSYIASPVTIADVDANGDCDILFASGNQIYALKNDGTVLWRFEEIEGFAPFRGVIAADITDDGHPEIIFGSSSGVVYALRGANGHPLWSINLKEHIGKDFEINHAPVVADFDGDGTLELFIIGGYSEYPNFRNNYGRGYTLSIGKGKDNQWTMFQYNNYRNSNACQTVPSKVEENKIDLPYIASHEETKLLISTSKKPYYTRVYIYDTMGRETIPHSISINDSIIEIVLEKSLPSGVYFVVVVGTDGYEIHKFARYK